MKIEAGLRNCFLMAALCLCPALAVAHGSQSDITATVWGVFINKPSACTSVPCSEADAFAEGNPTETDVCYITGGRAQIRGRATFGGRFAEGSHFSCIYSGLGLKDAETTEIHFVVQIHGSVKKELLTDQVTVFQGGCPPQPCLDVHFSIHVVDGAHESVSKIYRFKDGSMINNATSVLRRFADGIKVSVNTRFFTVKDRY